MPGLTVVDVPGSLESKTTRCPGEIRSRSKSEITTRSETRNVS